MRILVHSPAHLECFYVKVHTCITPAHSDIPGWLGLDQRCCVCRRGYWTLFSLVMNMTNLIIANVETLSHDDG